MLKADASRRAKDIASARFWLAYGAPLADVITMLEVRYRFAFSSAFSKAQMSLSFCPDACPQLPIVRHSDMDSPPFCSMASECVDCPSSGYNFASVQRSARDYVLMSGSQSNSLIVNNQRVASLHHDHVFVIVVRMWHRHSVLSTRPKCHLCTVDSVKNIAFDSGSRLATSSDWIHVIFHEIWKCIHAFHSPRLVQTQISCKPVHLKIRRLTDQRYSSTSDHKQSLWSLSVNRERVLVNRPLGAVSDYRPDAK
jgi:hypothetical protein